MDWESQREHCFGVAADCSFVQFLAHEANRKKRKITLLKCQLYDSEAGLLGTGEHTPYLRGKLQFSSSLSLPGRTEHCMIFSREAGNPDFSSKMYKEEIKPIWKWDLVHGF